MIGRATGLIALLIGAIALFSAAWVARRAPTPDDIARAVAYQENGADHFAYLKGDDGDVRDGKAEIRLWIMADGVMSDVSFFISPAQAARNYNDPAYWAFADEKFGRHVVYKGGVLSGHSLPPGDYIVEIAARNGTVIEHLNFHGSPLRQTFTLERDGKYIGAGAS